MTGRAGGFGPHRGRSGPRTAALTAALVALLLAGLAGVPGATATASSGVAAVTSGAAPTEAALARWTGGLDLYRPGAYTRQLTWYWCTAANAQIMRNLKDGNHDHSRADQAAYFAYMRAHDRYAIPVTDGTDPQGWADGLAHYVDSRYRLLTYSSFDSALHDAVTRMRLTGLPVSLAVMHGNHAWVLDGFTATADPAVTSHFTVTTVRVTGPLYGLQSVDGYDMPPDTKISTAAFRTFFTPFHYAPVRMAWEGRYVTIQPVPRTGAAPSTAPAVRPTAPPATASAEPPAAVPDGPRFPWGPGRPGLA